MTMSISKNAQVKEEELAVDPATAAASGSASVEPALVSDREGALRFPYFSHHLSSYTIPADLSALPCDLEDEFRVAPRKRRRLALTSGAKAEASPPPPPPWYAGVELSVEEMAHAVGSISRGNRCAWGERWARMTPRLVYPYEGDRRRYDDKERYPQQPVVVEFHPAFLKQYGRKLKLADGMLQLGFVPEPESRSRRPKYIRDEDGAKEMYEALLQKRRATRHGVPTGKTGGQQNQQQQQQRLGWVSACAENFDFFDAEGPASCDGKLGEFSYSATSSSSSCSATTGMYYGYYNPYYGYYYNSGGSGGGSSGSSSIDPKLATWMMQYYSIGQFQALNPSVAALFPGVYGGPTSASASASASPRLLPCCEVTEEGEEQQLLQLQSPLTEIQPLPTSPVSLALPPNATLPGQSVAVEGNSAKKKKQAASSLPRATN